MIEEDGAYYAQLAASFARGDLEGGLSTAWPPLYPALIASIAAPWSWLTGAAGPLQIELAARIVSAVAGALLLVPLYHLASALLPERWARLAVVFAAVHPRLIEYSASALTESAYALLLVAALARIVRRGPGLLAGAALGLAYLARPEALVIAAALAFVVAVSGRRRLRETSARLGAFALGVLLVALPYLIWMHGQLGVWSIGEKGAYNFWRTYREEYAELYPSPERLAARVNQGPDLAREVPPETPHLGSFVARRPGLVLTTSLSHLGTILISTLPVTVYAPFALLAIFGALPSRLVRDREPGAPRFAASEPRAKGAWTPVVVVLVATVLLYSPLSVDRRFFVPSVPLLLLLAARGMARLHGPNGSEGEALDASHAHAPRPGPLRRRAAVAAAWALGVFSVAYAVRGSIPRDPPVEHREAGLVLGRIHPRPEIRGGDERSDARRPIVVSRKPWVAYYAGASIRPLPDASGESPDPPRSWRGDYIVVDERSARGDRPYLGALLNPSEAPATWSVVHTVDAPRKLVLYGNRASSGR